MGQCHAADAREVGPTFGRPERIAFSPQGSVKRSSVSSFPANKEDLTPPAISRQSSGIETDCLPEIVAMMARENNLASSSDTDNVVPSYAETDCVAFPSWPPHPTTLQNDAHSSDTDALQTPEFQASDDTDALSDTDNAIGSDADTDCVTAPVRTQLQQSQVSDTDDAFPNESLAGVWPASPPTSPGLDETLVQPKRKARNYEAQQRQQGTVHPQQQEIPTKLKNDIIVIGRGCKPIVIR